MNERETINQILVRLRKVELRPAGTSGDATWGDITGEISSQTDLQTALDAKPSAPTTITAATGWPAALRKQVTVSAASCVPSSQISVTWQNVANQDENDPEMDLLTFKATPSTGSFSLVVSTDGNQKFGGNLKLKYELS